MEAYLWDGSKSIKGNLEFKKHTIDFVMNDFIDSGLQLSIEYESIIKISSEKVYEHRYKALAIITNNGKKNVFVVEDFKEFKNQILFRTLKI
ncbi:MAG TPA: hypothetical protein PLC27_02485 [Saprospiraceae bacterium]|nr:hypothetical protein [Saprospiraceae bacterium]